MNFSKKQTKSFMRHAPDPKYIIIDYIRKLNNMLRELYHSQIFFFFFGLRQLLCRQWILFSFSCFVLHCLNFFFFSFWIEYLYILRNFIEKKKKIIWWMGCHIVNMFWMFTNEQQNETIQCPFNRIWVRKKIYK